MFYLLQRPTIDQCTTLPITGYYIHAIVTSRNEDVNERIYTSKYIDDMLGGTMGEFSVSYSARFEQDLEPNANYIFVVNTENNVLEIPRIESRPSSNRKYLYLSYFSHMSLSDYVCLQCLILHELEQYCILENFKVKTSTVFVD